jgi:lipopolysaccharide export system protein LptA
MFARIKRTAATFAVVLVVFSAYRLLAVPLIEPKVEKKRLASVTPEERESIKQKQQDRLGGYARYFPPGSWELNDPMVLESDTSKLLLKEYTVLTDGRLQITPCTVIGFPDGDAEDPASNRRVIIAQIPQGGVLQFDSPVDLNRGKIGRLVGAVFSGPVTIRSAATRPDGSDSLYVATHDVQLVDNLVTTDKEVDFQYGPSTGHGRAMRMQLLPATGPPGKRGAINIGGVQSLELTYDVTMHIVPGSSGMMPGDNRPSGMFPGRAIAGRNPSSPASRQPQPPLDIRCQGPFDFDMQSYVATFHDAVTVLRPNPAGTGQDDQLRNCDTLIVGFAPRETATPKSADSKSQTSDAGKSPPRTGGVPPLETRWMKAFGNPVTVDAPSNDLFAKGQRLAYDVATGRIELESDGEAFLRWKSDEAHARSLMYEPGPGGAWLGLAESKGPGWTNVAVGDDISRRFEARWSHELKMRPQDDNSVISLIGDASASFTGRGEISAPEIHLWLHETVPPPQDVSARKNIDTAGRQARIQPVKMLADGGVHIESPQLGGTIKRLQAWFRESEPGAAQSSQPGGSRNAFSQRQPSASGQHRHYEIRRGNLLQAWFVEGPAAPRGRGATPGVSENLALDNVVLDGNVWFAESASAGSEKPLEILGDKLQVDHATAADTAMLVVGRPAHVSAQGMTLFGPSVQMDRAANRLWIDGAGKMTIDPNRPPQNPQAASAVQQQLGDFMTTNAATTVTWQQSMQFDGRIARFERDVVAEQTEPDRTRTIHAPTMEVTLHDRVDFGAARLDRGQPNQQPVVELLACRGDVLLENRQTQGGGVIAFDRMNVRDLTVNRLTGELAGQGPGHLTGWHLGTPADLGLQSGGPASGGTNVRPVAARGTPADSRPSTANSPARSGEKQINFIGVQFQHGISGNVLPQHQQLVFHDQVRTIVGPVPTWDAQLDPDVVGGVPPGGTSINSDQLTVSEVELPSSAQRTAELDAEGNVEVEGQQQQGDLFMAQAHHLTYSQAKDLLVLTGDGLSPAKLDQRRTPTSPPYQTAAPKIEFWRSQRRVVAPNGVEYAEGRLNAPRAPTSGHPGGAADRTR